MRGLSFSSLSKSDARHASASINSLRQNKTYRQRTCLIRSLKVEGPPEHFDHRLEISSGADQIIKTQYPQLLDLAEKGEDLESLHDINIQSIDSSGNMSNHPWPEERKYCL